MLKMNDSVIIQSKQADEKFCTDCGGIIKSKAEICPKCGVRQSSPPGAFGNTAPNGKSKTAAALLAFFLGGFGVHKFYLGQVGMGILYLIFFWTFIPAIVAFIEFIILLTMSDEAFNQKFGNA
jgi:TM2 domain-containing membrane protein YozV